MADVVDTSTRSRMMSGIRSRNTKPEIALRKRLFRAGYRYRLHRRDLPGRPDLVLPRFRAVIQVHGCFWHRHEGCHFCTTPASNMEFWSEKFSRNVERDSRNRELLQAAGWRVGIVWECSLRHNPDGVVSDVIRWLEGTDKSFETNPSASRKQL